MDRHFQRFFPIFLAIVIVGLLYWGWCYLRRPTTLPFHHVQLVYPAQRIDEKQIRQLAWNNIDGGFFSLKVDKLKAALLHQPWIASVSIRRKWPDTVALSIDEKPPEARWGAKGVISANADVFYPPPDSIPVGLSTIIAPLGQKNEILSNFQKLSDILLQLHLRVKTLTVTDRGVYQMTLSNGVRVMIGRDDVQQRFRRFVDLYPKIIEGRRGELAGVDLRYPNGFSVKWKSKRL